MEGNEPPAGGFGAGSPTGTGWQPPRARPYPVFAVVCIALGALVFGVMFVAYNSTWKTAQRVQQSQGDRIVESVSANAVAAYQRSGTLCPSAAPVPAAPIRDVHHSKREDWENDPGWTCLGYEYVASLHCQVRYDVAGDTVYVLALYPTRSVSRKGHIDHAQNTLVFDPIEHRGRGQ